MVEILALVLQHDEQAVLTAVELALEAGAPTKTHILNLLHRLVDGKPIDTPPVKAPQALTLTTEPQSQRRTLRRPAQGPGGAPCVMIPPPAPSSSCCAALKMHGMAQAVGELTEQGSPAFEAALPILSQLLKAETAEQGGPVDGLSAQGRPLPELPRPRRLRLRQQRGQRGAGPPAPSLRVPGGRPQRRPGRRSRHRQDASRHGASASRPSSITASASGSSPPSNSSTPSNRRSSRESLGRSPGGSPIPTSSSSTSSATCRSAPPAARCSSIC